LADPSAEFGWSFPLWGIRQPKSVGAFPVGGFASRNRLGLSPLGDPSAEIGWSFPRWGILQPEALFIPPNVKSFINQHIKPSYLGLAVKFNSIYLL
jgi:aminoglycoside phosphotransferase (APT) family kinase protein